MAKAILETVFSEYEVYRLNMIFPALAESEQPEVGTIKCIGTLEETSDVRKVVKKCRGVDAKVVTIGAGTGTLKLTLHMPWALYVKALAMDADKDLIEGVVAYGRKSIHPEFAMTAHVKDEDGIEKYKAWPRCVVTNGPSRKVENGAEEVAEIDLELSFMPDDYDNGVYEALSANLKDDTVKTGWLQGFTPDMVHAKEVE
ncbi:hypothetical protein [Adlercreutzia mucosicola]|uniref:hypothetical protein n=1 Tax=Adlercreutzia mucosicola TaxID=580026 RepID=UPI00042331C9|nr:hypothetical protein [Adlercreutzia mucosicola]MCR2034151.1 hypothetical protein [Adlercreutzia mucosicola]